MTTSEALAVARAPTIQTWAPLAVAVACAGGLAAALVGQHVFGLEPCVLCLWQRAPYAAAGVFALAALVLPAGRTRIILVALSGFVLLGGAGLAFFHVGVEQHWWTSSLPGCGGDEAFLTGEMSLSDFQARLAGPPPKPCDEVDWQMFGISLAGYNALASLALSVAAAIGAMLMRKGFRS